MRSFFIPFLIAVQFLTRLPVSFLLKQNNVYTADNQSRSLKYYPLVGFIIGAILLAFILLLNYFSANHTVYITVLSVVLWVALTGGLHLDGVADMADAWVGGLGDKDKTLHIMKDPTCGPFGVIAIVLTIVLKLVFVYELINISPWLILLPPLLSRSAVVIMLMRIPYARPQGLGSDLSTMSDKHINTASVVVFTVTALALMAVLSNAVVLLGTIFVSILFYIMFTLNVVKRIGGITGDIAGAFIEYMELIVLFSIITFTFMFQVVR